MLCTEVLPFSLLYTHVCIPISIPGWLVFEICSTSIPYRKIKETKSQFILNHFFHQVMTSSTDNIINIYVKRHLLCHSPSRDWVRVSWVQINSKVITETAFADVLNSRTYVIGIWYTVAIKIIYTRVTQRIS